MSRRFLPRDALPILRRGYRIDVSLHLADGRAGGLLISNGSRGRGIALYMQNGHVIYESDRVDAPARLTTVAALLAGAHVVTVDVSKAPSECRENMAAGPACGTCRSRSSACTASKGPARRGSALLWRRHA